MTAQTHPVSPSLTATSYAVTLNDIHARLSRITTIEELDALPPESVILEADEVAMTKDHSGCWFAGRTEHRFMSYEVYLPALLLWLGRNRFTHDTDQKDTNS